MIFETSTNMFFGTYFRFDMQSEAFRFEKSFEHSPKQSTLLLYIVFNDLNVENHIFKTKMSKINFDITFPT